MWAKMAKASLAALAGGTSDPVFHETKLATARFYMARQLPMTGTHLARIQSGADRSWRSTRRISDPRCPNACASPAAPTSP
jgi:hypothetical protein